MVDAGEFSCNREESRDKFSKCWTFSVDDATPNEFDPPVCVPDDVKESFSEDGFAVFPYVLKKSLIEELNNRLEEVLRGRYDRNSKPDKTPKLLKNEYRNPQTHAKTTSKKDQSSESENEAMAKPKISYAAGPLGFSGNLQNVKVLQVINVHKADSVFRKLAVSPALGRVVAELAGWTNVGTRLAQDQV